MPEQFVFIVNRVDEIDGLYVFTDEAHAREFAARYDDAVVTEEIVMNGSAGAQFLIETHDDDLGDDPPGSPCTCGHEECGAC